MIEFALAEHVRGNFPARSGSGYKRRLNDTVALAASLAEQAFEEAARAGTKSEQIACRKGCSYCCHMRVVATVPEVIALHDFIDANLSASEVAALARRVVEVDQTTHGMSDEEWGMGNFPCPILVDGLCSAYEARPLDCRAYNSTSVPACCDASREYLEWDVPMNESLTAVNKSAQAGLLQGLTGAGYRPRLVELTAALRVVFEDSTAIERWLAGENTFAGAELDLSDPEQRAFLPWVPSDELRAALSDEQQ